MPSSGERVTSVCTRLVLSFSPRARQIFSEQAIVKKSKSKKEHVSLLTMRLTVALWPFLSLAFDGAVAPATLTHAAPAAAPIAAPPAAAAPAVGAAVADFDEADDDVVPLPEDEVLDPAEVALRHNTEKTKDACRRIMSDFCLWLHDDDASGDEVMSFFYGQQPK